MVAVLLRPSKLRGSVSQTEGIASSIWCEILDQNQKPEQSLF
ncbi:hypothetical protein NIES2109_62450 (plasmid) [Nostoc sp. HK-01]|nr:hypothetical protein NIES2109_62450 [Nostoc sp. HK-01]